MSAERKYFGTDGIRGRVGEPPITPDFVMKLGWAAGRVLANGRRGEIIIGKDTRISGYMFESALEAGLSAAGMDVCLLGPMPTPGIAYLTRSSRALAGIVISASHNPHQDNGIKFFASDGTKLPDEVELAIEVELEQPLHTVESGLLGKARRMMDAPGRYIEFCKSAVSRECNFRGLKIVLDCAHGATYQLAPKVFSELGATVISIGVHPDGLNINEKSGATNTASLQAAVLNQNANLGIAFDGDGDRVMMVDHTGIVLDGDDILYIIASANPGGLNGAVVGTVMSNLGLEQAIHNLGLGFVRASVGDRYVLEKLNKDNLILGGETSGHIINLRKTTTGDGIISALQVLETMVTTGKSLHDLKAGWIKFPQKMINVKMHCRVDPFTLNGVPAAIRTAETELGSNGRILIRTSGTEPLIRVMVEGREENQVNALAAQLAAEIEQALQSI